MTEGIDTKPRNHLFDDKVVDLKDVAYDEKVRLIGFVRQNHCLWNPGDENYCCSGTRKIAWGTIAQQMSTPMSVYTEKTVYNIWRNLSDTLKKKISRLRSKFGADESLDIALSDWRYHQHMRFMVEILDMGVPHLQQQPQASFSGIVITESSNSMNSSSCSLSDGVSTSHCSPPPMKRMRKEKEEVKHEIANSDTTEEFPTSNMTSFLSDPAANHNPVIAQATGDTVAELYRNLELCGMKVAAAKFRKEISDIVYKYEMEIAEALQG